MRRWPPKALIAKLNADTNRALTEPDLHDKLLAECYQPIGGTPEQFGELVRTEVEHYGKIIHEVGIKPN